jgi:hypothetical protein
MSKKLNSDEINLSEIFFVISKKKWIFFLIVALSLTIPSIINFSSIETNKEIKIKATTEIRPIKVIDEVGYNTFIKIFNVIIKHSLISQINDLKSKGENFDSNMDQQYSNVIENYSIKFLFNSFSDMLKEKPYLKNAIRKANILEEKNYSNKAEYETAIAELATSIKLIGKNDLISSEKKIFLTVTADKSIIKNWNNFLKFINDEINVEIQNKLDSIFNNYLLIVKEIHDYKIEDIESRLEKAVSETDILILNQIKTKLLSRKYNQRMLEAYKKSPFSKKNEFYAANIIYDSTIFEPEEDERLSTEVVYSLFAILGVIFATFFVLILNYMQKKSKR